MGVIGEALEAYAQPLLDGTDGSVEQLNKAFTLGILCYNLAVLPEHSREEALGEVQTDLHMDDEELAVRHLNRNKGWSQCRGKPREECGTQGSREDDG